MCGRYYIDQEEDQIEIRKILTELNQRYKANPLLSSMKLGEIFPTNTVPVLAATSREDHETRETMLPIGSDMVADSQPELMTWGFPMWNRPGVLINARAETAAQKPTFRQAVQTNRILVPASAYFEWTLQPEHGQTRTRQGKTKMCIRLENGGPLWMAGLAREEKQADGISRSVFVIITRPAEAEILPIHDRMPLILNTHNAYNWIYDNAAALQMLQSPPRARMTAIDAFEMTI